jgi:hypothetical protein
MIPHEVPKKKRNPKLASPQSILNPNPWFLIPRVGANNLAQQHPAAATLAKDSAPHTKHHTPNNKQQIPNTKHQTTSTKHQTPDTKH